jgi:hypothetical protein
MLIMICLFSLINDIFSTMTSVIKHLSGNDVLVLWGGANDIYKNNSWDALKCIASFIEENKHTNVIILCVPLRHDLPIWSCVNIGIKAFNRMLVKLAIPHKHATVVKVDLERNCHTRHGQHMNHLGKDRIACRLAKVITNMFSMQGEIVTLPRMDDSEASSSGISDKDTISTLEHPTATPLSHMATKMTPEVPRQDIVADSNNDSDQIHDRSITGTQADESASCIQPQDAISAINSDSDPLGQTQDIHTTGVHLMNPEGQADETATSEELTANATRPSTLDQIPETVGKEGNIADILGNDEDIADMQGEPTSHPHNQQKVSCRRKRIPLTRTDDFLWE